MLFRALFLLVVALLSPLSLVSADTIKPKQPTQFRIGLPDNSGGEGICEAPSGSRCFYVAPNGSDQNTGRFDSPFASTNPFISSLQPGDVVYFRGGSYGAAAKGQIVNYSPWFPQYYAIAFIDELQGLPGKPITFRNYPGEKPVFDMYQVNPEYNPLSLNDGPNDAFHVYGSQHIVVSGFEIVHSSIVARDSDYVWIENNHVHGLLTNRSNNGLVMLYFTKHAWVRNNKLHDTYSRRIPTYDSEGNYTGDILNTTKSHYDAQHNGCLTTLSGDVYVGYGNESSGPFEIVGNEIHDCPVHLFIKNVQGHRVNAEGYNLVIDSNYFHGNGRLADHFKASNVVFRNNLLENIDGVSSYGSAYYDPTEGYDVRLNEINARNITWEHNVFLLDSGFARFRGHGYTLANGEYSTALEDHFKMRKNIIIFGESSTPSTSFGWNQGGFAFSNSYTGMTDTQPAPSRTLTRIYSRENCYVNSNGSNIAFLKQFIKTPQGGLDSLRGISYAQAQSEMGIDASGDLFPSSTNLSTHFMNPGAKDYRVKSGSPCAAITGIGLTNPARFEDFQ